MLLSLALVMNSFFLHNQALLFFLTLLLGFLLGEVKIFGVQLGSAAVLFAGLAVGSVLPKVHLPDAIIYIGLALFVYCLGLYSGEAFTSSFRGRLKWLQVLVVLAVSLLFATVHAANFLLNLESAELAGAFAGILTTTPALAGLLKAIGKVSTEAAQGQAVAYFSIAYPVGLVAVVAAVRVWEALCGLDPEKTPEKWFGKGSLDGKKLVRCVIEITHALSPAPTVQEFIQDSKLRVRFGRIRRGEENALATGSTRLESGAVISVLGTRPEIDRAVSLLGRESDRQVASFDQNTQTVDLYVSNPAVVNIPLRELDIEHDHHANVLKVRRGDKEFLPDGKTLLELGDTVRVAFPVDHFAEIQRLFGNSAKSGGEFDTLGLSLGICLGLFVGLVPLPFPGGIQVQFGVAGGPLIVGLILGNIKKTRSIVWRLSPNANMTLREFGLLLFLTGVGLKAGSSFLQTFLSSSGLSVLLSSFFIVFAECLLLLYLFQRVFGVALAPAVGMLAGFQTSPALLAFAQSHCRDDEVVSRYAVFYPLATCVKILLVQIFFFSII